MKISNLLKGVAAASLMAMCAAAVHAADYPSRPLRAVVPFPAGGGTDIVARIVLERMAKELGQPVIVENKAGGGTVIGTMAVAHAEADGYTVLFTSSAFSVNPYLLKDAPYDPIKSFAPVGSAAMHPFVLVASPSLPADNIQELVAYAKANPGKLNYASVGNGSSQHLGMELLKRMAGIDLVHIPYKGSSPAMVDLLGGQVSLMFNGISPTLGHIRAGKLKVLATDSATRVPLLPEVPTVAESGVPGFEITTWSGLLAPAGTPHDVVQKLGEVMQKVVNSPEVQKELTERGLIPTSMPPAQFAAFLKKDTEKWAELVKDAGVTAQ